MEVRGSNDAILPSFGRKAVIIKMFSSNFNTRSHYVISIVRIHLKEGGATSIVQSKEIIFFDFLQNNICSA